MIIVCTAEINCQNLPLIKSKSFPQYNGAAAWASYIPNSGTQRLISLFAVSNMSHLSSRPLFLFWLNVIPICELLYLSHFPNDKSHNRFVRFQLKFMNKTKVSAFRDRSPNRLFKNWTTNDPLSILTLSYWPNKPQYFESFRHIFALASLWNFWP